MEETFFEVDDEEAVLPSFAKTSLKGEDSLSESIRLLKKKKINKSHENATV